MRTRKNKKQSTIEQQLTNILNKLIAMEEEAKKLVIVKGLEISRFYSNIAEFVDLLSQHQQLDLEYSDILSKQSNVKVNHGHLCQKIIYLFEEMKFNLSKILSQKYKYVFDIEKDPERKMQLAQKILETLKCFTTNYFTSPRFILVNNPKIADLINAIETHISIYSNRNQEYEKIMVEAREIQDKELAFTKFNEALAVIEKREVNYFSDTIYTLFQQQRDYFDKSNIPLIKVIDKINTKEKIVELKAVYEKIIVGIEKIRNLILNITVCPEMKKNYSALMDSCTSSVEYLFQLSQSTLLSSEEKLKIIELAFRYYFNASTVAKYAGLNEFDQHSNQRLLNEKSAIQKKMKEDAEKKQEKEKQTTELARKQSEYETEENFLKLVQLIEPEESNSKNPKEKTKRFAKSKKLSVFHQSEERCSDDDDSVSYEYNANTSPYCFYFNIDLSQARQDLEMAEQNGNVVHQACHHVTIAEAHLQQTYDIRIFKHISGLKNILVTLDKYVLAIDELNLAKKHIENAKSQLCCYREEEVHSVEDWITYELESIKKLFFNLQETFDAIITQFKTHRRFRKFDIIQRHGSDAWYDNDEVKIRKANKRDALIKQCKLLCNTIQQKVKSSAIPEDEHVHHQKSNCNYVKKYDSVSDHNEKEVKIDSLDQVNQYMKSADGVLKENDGLVITRNMQGLDNLHKSFELLQCTLKYLWLAKEHIAYVKTQPEDDQQTKICAADDRIASMFEAESKRFDRRQVTFKNFIFQYQTALIRNQTTTQYSEATAKKVEECYAFCSMIADILKQNINKEKKQNLGFKRSESTYSFFNEHATNLRKNKPNLLGKKRSDVEEKCQKYLQDRYEEFKGKERRF